ncbi:MAG: hypothetical protein ABSG99_06395 [Sedimentisphaerales bacterium]
MNNIQNSLLDEGWFRLSPVLLWVEKQTKKQVNPNLEFATEFATEMYGWATVTLRLRFGQHHKFLFGSC